MLLLITYSSYDGAPVDAIRIVDEIVEQQAISHLKPMGDSVWFVETNASVDDWTPQIASRVRPGRLFVVRVQGRTNGWLDTKTWEWVNARAT